MGFNSQQLTLARGSFNRIANEIGSIEHIYSSTTDTLAEMQSAEYFPAFFGATSEDVKTSDLLLMIAVDGRASAIIDNVNPLELSQEAEIATVTDFLFSTNLEGPFISGDLPITLRISRSGNMIAIYFPETASTTTGTPGVIGVVDPLPIEFRPNVAMGMPALVLNEMTEVFGSVHIFPSGQIIIANGAAQNANFSIDSVGGVLDAVVTYHIN